MKTPNFALYKAPGYTVTVPPPSPAPAAANPRADITAADVLAIAPYCPKGRVDAVVFHFNRVCAAYGIDTAERAAMFFAQLAEECDSFKTMREYGSDAYFAYLDDRTDLGYVAGQGDGAFWAGHGPIEITGPYNHWLMGTALGIDCFRNPLLLTQDTEGFNSAAVFWRTCLRRVPLDCNRYADVGDIQGCTLAINGGLTGFQARATFYKNALPIFRRRSAELVAARAAHAAHEAAAATAAAPAVAIPIVDAEPPPPVTQADFATPAAEPPPPLPVAPAPPPTPITAPPAEVASPHMPPPPPPDPVAPLPPEATVIMPPEDKSLLGRAKRWLSSRTILSAGTIGGLSSAKLLDDPVDSMDRLYGAWTSHHRTLAALWAMLPSTTTLLLIAVVVLAGYIIWTFARKIEAGKVAVQPLINRKQ